MPKQAWMWLAAGLGPGAQNAGAVLAAFSGGAPEIWEHREGKELAELLQRGQRKRLLASKPDDFADALDQNRQRGVAVIPFSSRRYPQLLKRIVSPPPVLFVKGDATLLNGKLCMGMVGTRTPSAYGVEVMKTLGRQVAAAGIVVVSGLAAGLDAEAHKAALAAQGATLACIAFGHGSCYPANNRNLLEVVERYGAVISEYPLDTTAEKAFFLQRNRLIAALSHGIVVVEARERSGTMSTVNFAAEYGRDVFAVPGSIFSPLSIGTNSLLREGATPVGSAADVLALYQGQLTLGKVPLGGGVPLLQFAPREWQHQPLKLAAELPEQENEPRQPAILGQPNVPQPDALEQPNRPRKRNAAQLPNTAQLPTAWQRPAVGEEEKPEDDRAQPISSVLTPLHPPSQVSDEALLVLAALGAQPAGLAQICEHSNLAPATAMAALTELELAGLSRQLAGRQFIIMQ